MLGQIKEYKQIFDGFKNYYINFKIMLLVRKLKYKVKNDF